MDKSQQLESFQPLRFQVVYCCHVMTAKSLSIPTGISDLSSVLIGRSFILLRRRRVLVWGKNCPGNGQHPTPERVGDICLPSIYCGCSRLLWQRRHWGSFCLFAVNQSKQRGPIFGYYSIQSIFSEGKTYGQWNSSPVKNRVAFLRSWTKPDPLHTSLELWCNDWRKKISNHIFFFPSSLLCLVYVTEVYVLYFRPVPSWTFTFLSFKTLPSLLMVYAVSSPFLCRTLQLWLHWSTLSHLPT